MTTLSKITCDGLLRWQPLLYCIRALGFVLMLPGGLLTVGAAINGLRVSLVRSYSDHKLTKYPRSCSEYTSSVSRNRPQSPCNQVLRRTSKVHRSTGQSWQRVQFRVLYENLVLKQCTHRRCRSIAFVDPRK